MTMLREMMKSEGAGEFGEGLEEGVSPDEW